MLVVAPSEDVSGAAAATGRIRADQRIDTRRATLVDHPEVAAHAIASSTRGSSSSSTAIERIAEIVPDDLAGAGTDGETVRTTLRGVAADG